MPSEKIPAEFGDGSIDLCFDTIKKGKQALVFVNAKRSAEKTAEELSKRIKPSEAKFFEIADSALKALSKPTKQCERLAFCLRKGIAFHHAGLAAKQRELIEDNFRAGIIKIICATPTLAFGLDLPAYRSIIKDLRRYGSHGYNWIPVLEYLQQAGRAGRPGYDKLGEAIVIAGSEAEKGAIYERYILGSPEDIHSKLAVEPVLRTYLLSLIAANFVRTKEQIMSFFERTFWAQQFEDMEKLEMIIDKMLRLLEEWEFISMDQGDFQDADEVGSGKIAATIMGKRVAELYIDPLTANFLINCLRNASDRHVKDLSFLHMVSHTLEMRPLLRVKAKETDKVQEFISLNHGYFLENEPSLYDPEYDEYFDSVKTAMMLNDWIDEKDEEYLLEEYNVRPGELRVKLDNSDWLMYSAEEMARILHFQKLIKDIRKARLRVQYGVKEELLPLLKLEQIGRMRARRLYNNKIKDVGDIKSTDLMKLIQILGEKTAMHVKKQVGEEVKEVPEGKRKGQISLRDY